MRVVGSRHTPFGPEPGVDERAPQQQPVPERATSSPSPAVGTALFETKMDALTSTRRTVASSMDVHAGGREELGALLEGVSTAQRSVRIQTLHFENDAVGRKVADALIAAARRGVAVSVRVDAYYFGKLGPLRERMEAAGVNVEKSHGTPGWFGIGGHNPMERDHKKIYVFDDERALVGGFNITKHNYEWDDVLVELTGPAARDLGLQMQRDAGASVSSPAPEKRGLNTRILTTSPRDGDTDTIRNAYLLAIRGARKSIRLQHAYLTDPKIIEALAKAAERGVDVQVVLPGKNAEKIPEAAAEAHYDRLLEAGVDLRELRGMTHAKAMSVDGAYAIVGSANLMTALQRTQDELVVAISDRGTIRRLDRELFDDVARRSTLLTSENVDRHRALFPIRWGAAALDAFLGYGLFGARIAHGPRSR